MHPPVKVGDVRLDVPRDRRGMFTPGDRAQARLAG
jgi:hypothetical protein